MYETIDRLLDGPPPGASERELVDWIARLEAVKCRAEAVQAEASVRLEEAARARQLQAGVPARKLGEGVASQIALARRVSPDRGAKLLGLAKILLIEMPHTFGLMKAGLFSQWQATILARETACLSLEDRRVIDHELCAPGPNGQPAKAVAMGLRQLENAAKKLAITLDQAAVVTRAANAEKDRRVSLRPAPDTMTWLGALLPVKDGVAVFAALDQAANAARAAGDERARGQVMADTLVDRVTGRSTAEAKPRIEVKIVMTADSLANTGDQPAMVEGYGPVPATWARDALSDAEVFVRRLFTDPAGQLVAMESRSRKAPDRLAEFIATRDGGTCRTVGCDAPIRNIDHIQRHTDGGETTAENLQGLCERCNQAKEAIGWRARPGPDGSITTITPTGHTYTSPPPDTWGQDPPPLSRAELTLRDVLLDHTLAA
ncbi:putative HNH endonuclease domain protein [Nocardioidaceae bacterium Broad-1]|nr:putative HNH endonuclease domain protein [Nocardioidaceae bacterium Broad-1]EGD44122.1 putative HNH endonuclease domain protein [Nocardioidaceae bacterium Broad-1]